MMQIKKKSVEVSPKEARDVLESRLDELEDALRESIVRVLENRYRITESRLSERRRKED